MYVKRSEMGKGGGSSNKKTAKPEIDPATSHLPWTSLHTSGSKNAFFDRENGGQPYPCPTWKFRRQLVLKCSKRSSAGGNAATRTRPPPGDVLQAGRGSGRLPPPPNFLRLTAKEPRERDEGAPAASKGRPPGPGRQGDKTLRTGRESGPPRSPRAPRGDPSA